MQLAQQIASPRIAGGRQRLQSYAPLMQPAANRIPPHGAHQGATTPTDPTTSAPPGPSRTGRPFLCPTRIARDEAVRVEERGDDDIHLVPNEVPDATTNHQCHPQAD